MGFKFKFMYNVKFSEQQDYKKIYKAATKCRNTINFIFLHVFKIGYFKTFKNAISITNESLSYLALKFPLISLGS